MYLTRIAVTTVLLAGGCSQSSESGRRDTFPMEKPQQYICHRTTTAIIVDGRMDEAAWEGASWTRPFADIEGSRKPCPPLKSRVKMLWDDEFFYLGAELEEPHVWATLKEHDQIVFQDNDFEVFIDPDGDAREYYEIEINALNTVFDLFLVRTYDEGGPALHAWDCTGLKSAVYVDGTLNDPTDVDRGWSIEMALPWKTLGEAAHRPAPPRNNDTWRVNFSRVEWRHRLRSGQYEKAPGQPENNWVWSPQGVINMHVPQRWGYVEFAADGN